VLLKARTGRALLIIWAVWMRTQNTDGFEHVRDYW
jgi:hypothetical protein